MIRILSKEQNTEKMEKRLKALEEIRGVRGGTSSGTPEEGSCCWWCKQYCGDCENDTSMLQGNIAYR